MSFFKIIIYFVFLLVFQAALISCSVQKDSWLETNDAEFEKLYSLFPGVRLKGELFNLTDSQDKNFIEDTLRVGKWEGSVEQIGDSPTLRITITQTVPTIKGTYVLLYPAMDIAITKTGSLVGKMEKGKILFVLQHNFLDSTYKDIFDYLECKCFSYDFVSACKDCKIQHRHIILGKIESSQKSYFESKGYFYLFKEEFSEK